MNGGTAFPARQMHDSSGKLIGLDSQGMSLRDYFAGIAMGSLVRHNISTEAERKRLAAEAYRIGQAMVDEWLRLIADEAHV